MEAFVDSTNDSGSRQLWPLVKVVRVQGPWEPLAGGVVLVDAPGVQGERRHHKARLRARRRLLMIFARRECQSLSCVPNPVPSDDNSARDAVVKAYLRKVLRANGAPSRLALLREPPAEATQHSDTTPYARTSHPLSLFLCPPARPPATG